MRTAKELTERARRAMCLFAAMLIVAATFGLSAIAAQSLVHRAELEQDVRIAANSPTALERGLR